MRDSDFIGKLPYKTIIQVGITACLMSNKNILCVIEIYNVEQMHPF